MTAVWGDDGDGYLRGMCLKVGRRVEEKPLSLSPLDKD